LRDQFPNSYIVAFAEIWQGSLSGSSTFDLHYDYGKSVNNDDKYTMQITDKSVEICDTPVYNIDGTILQNAGNTPVVISSNLVPLFICDFGERATDDIRGTGIY